MMKYFLIPAVLSLVVLGALGDNAFAQRGRWGGGWGNGGWGNGGWGNGGMGYGGYGYGNGYGGMGYGGMGYGGYNGYGGNYGSPYYYNSPYYSNSYYNTIPSYSYYPSGNLVSPTPTVNNNTAMIRVILPDPNGQVFLDGQRTSSTGSMRTYQTPPLSGAQSFSYQLKAVFMRNGQQVTEERNVSVTPGQTTTIDFTRPQ